MSSRSAHRRCCALALALLVVHSVALAQGAPPSPAVPAPQCPAVVEIVKAIAWPLFALVIALALREPILRAAAAVGKRVTKVSAFNVSLELAAATSTGANATPMPLLEDIQHASSAALISDSARMMFDQVQATEHADYSVIDIGAGDEWLTSRLFIAAAMLRRMRGVEVIVFVDRAQGADRRFVALTSADSLRWRLARRFPALEASFARAYAELQPGAFPGTPFLPHAVAENQPFVKSDTGALDPAMARRIVAKYLEALEMPAAGTPPSAPPGWVALDHGPAGPPQILERATWVTRDLLRELLPDDDFRRSAPEAVDAPQPDRTRAVLRRHGAFVALLDPLLQFSRLVNRSVLLESLASRLANEHPAD
jgi:hypothetical protein